MNKKQRATLDFITKFSAANGYFPTLSEIAVGLGMSHRSKGVISERVNSLVRLGYFVRHGKRLGWRVLGSPEQVISDTYEHAVRLLNSLSPGTTPMPSTIGVLDQIDNWTTQFTKRAA
jgi:hypothetical protein